MAVYLDDEAVALEGEDLGGVLASASERLKPSGRVVVEVEVDGQKLVGEQIDRRLDTPVQQAHVRLRSAEPRELTLTALAQVRQRLLASRQTHEDAAELLQQDRAGEALQQLAQSVEVWMQTQQVVSHAATLLGLPLDEIAVEGKPLAQIADELVEQLEGLKQLLADNDTVALADSLSYEWPRTIDQWDALLGELIERVDAD